jgi:tRNA threonylcarbamoyladenosine biosynthesis protein TsaE
MLSFVVNSEASIEEAAKKIIRFAGDCTIWLFDGEMGAGKTTLIKSICKVFQVTDNVSSPSFSIINEYQNAEGKHFYHFDFYRIKNEREALDLGLEEYFDSVDICMIEWPSMIASWIPDRYLNIKIEIISEHSRKIYLTRHG